MSAEIKAFLKHFNSVTDHCGRFCCMTRGVEFQTAAIDDLEKLLSETRKVKHSCVEKNDEDLANLVLSLEAMANSMQSELRMWVSLKQDEPNKAWSHLVKAQVDAASSIRAHESAAHIETYVKRLRRLEEILFPVQAFNSIGHIVKKSRCSICDGEYAECDPLKGKAYMGEFCVREILDSKLIEVSLVGDPANRDCRITHIEDDDGVYRDVMTWRETPRKGNGDASIQLNLKA